MRRMHRYGGPVEIVANEPSAWFLLHDDGQHYLDVNCSQAFVSFSLLLRLDDEETAQWRAHGTAYLDRLAGDVQYHSDRYVPRDLTPELGERCDAAIAAYRSASVD